jgi:putative oxidoreductase
MSYGILLLRVALGLSVAAHGAQKIFGAFGGHGPSGTAGYFGTLGFRAPMVLAVVAGLAELSCIMLAAGLLTPLACLAIVVVMFSAIGSVHWRNGFWNTAGGYELNLLIVAGATAIAATGPGRFSLDRLIGWDDNLSGLWWGVGVLVVGAAFSAITLTVGRYRPHAGEAHAGGDEGLRKAA